MKVKFEGWVKIKDVEDKAKTFDEFYDELWNLLDKWGIKAELDMERGWR